MKEKYYNVKEALDYIRSYPSGRIEKEFYMIIFPYYFSESYEWM